MLLKIFSSFPNRNFVFKKLFLYYTNNGVIKQTLKKYSFLNIIVKTYNPRIKKTQMQ